MKTSSCRFSVCPHDTAKNLADWFLLNTYLQKKLNCGLHFEPCDHFDQEREMVLRGGYQLVYANPYSATVFAQVLGFVPVAKPIAAFDETLLLARQDFKIEARRSLKIAAASSRLIVYVLGLTLLAEHNIARAQCEISFVGTHPKAAQAVAEERADLAFVFRDTWFGMSESLRATMQVIAQTDSRLAFHCFCVAPEWLVKRERLQAILCGMKDDPQGKRILDDLRFCGFEALPENALDALHALVAQVTP